MLSIPLLAISFLVYTLSFMRLHRFYIEENIGNKKEITLSDSTLVHQLRSVFRLKTGDSLILFDGSSFEYVSEIVLITSERVTVVIREVRDRCYSPKKNIHLLQSVIKKDNFEWVLEKCTELGVSRFTPVISERTEKKNINLDRARIIVKEASEQSGRCSVPAIDDICDLKDILQEYKDEIVVFHMEGMSLRDSSFALRDTLKVLVGPEGGWSEKEIALFKEKNIPIVSVGAQVLRAETASVAIATLLLL